MKLINFIVGLATIGYASASVATILSDIGGYASDFNLGFCLAFQDDQTDTTTTCYDTCTTTGTYITDFFDSIDFSNTDSMLNSFQDLSIQFMGQFKDCKTTEWLYSLDNRLSDVSFFSGSVANVGTQIGTFVGYYYMIQDMACDPSTLTATMDIVMCKLLLKHPFTKIYNDMWPEIQALFSTGASAVDF